MSGFSTWSARPDLNPGAYPRGNELEAITDEISTRSVIAWGNRPSNSTGFTTEIGILRLDNIAIQSGRMYLIWCPPIHVFSTVASDDVSGVLRYTVDGTAATTASTALHSDPAKVSGASVDRGGSVAPVGVLVPSADGVLSVLLSGVRTNGTGTCNLLATMNLLVEACGTAPTDTGVDL